MVVHDVCQVVGGQVISTLVEDLVVEHRAVEADASTDHIVDLDLYIGLYEEAHHVLLACCDEALDLLSGERQGVAHRAARRSIVLEVGLRLALRLEFLGCVEGNVGLACVEELLHVLAVDISALALAVGAAVAAIAYSLVEVYPKPLEGLDDVGLRPRDEALAVGILDAQQELAAVALSEEVVI